MMTVTRKLAGLAATTVGILGVAAAMTTVGTTSVTAAPTSPTPQSVLVVNSAAQPVPTVATGTTAISGTVSIGNTVTAHLDSNQVILDNTVPLVTRDADGGTPVSARVTFPLQQGIVGSGGIFAVPAGKRLIVDYVSGRVTGGNGDERVRGTIELSSSQGSVPLQRHHLIPTIIAPDEVIFSAPIRAYYGPNETLAMRAERRQDVFPTTVLQCEFQLSGRLVDIP